MLFFFGIGAVFGLGFLLRLPKKGATCEGLGGVPTRWHVSLVRQACGAWRTLAVGGDEVSAEGLGLWWGFYAYPETVFNRVMVGAISKTRI